jgi:hypothetical protein
MNNQNDLPISQKVYWDIESEFLYDYIMFGSNLRYWQTIDIKPEKYQMEQQGKGLYFVNLLEGYQKSLEDLGAMCLAIKRRFQPDSNCSYQKHFTVSQTPITYTLINYRPQDYHLEKIAKLSDQEIEKALNLQSINRISVTFIYPDFNYLTWRANIIKTLKSQAYDQSKRLNIYNKIKHGAVVVSNGRKFKKSLPLGPAAIYRNPNKDESGNPLMIHAFKYEEKEFKLMIDGIKSIRQMIRELIAIYLIEHYPEHLKQQGISTPLLLLKKVQS